jgi:DnaJ-class molecular chaperone
MNLREIDRLVEKHIMNEKGIKREDCVSCGGLGRIRLHPDFCEECSRCNGSGKIKIIPFYSTDLVRAWQVVEKMKEARFSIRKRFIDELQREVTPEETKNRGNLIDAGWMIFFLTPKAICVAALKAVGVEVEKEE